MHRHLRYAQLACLAWLAAALLAPAAFAQGDAPRPYRYVAEWSIARDQWAGYAEWSSRHHKPILESLAADGTLLDWGFFETYIHRAGESTHGLWWTSATISGIEKTRAALLKAPMHPAAAAGEHSDLLLRPLASGQRSGATAGGFLYVNTQDVRPGKEEAWKAMWDELNKPVLDALIADGSLAAYSIDYEDVHTSPNSLRHLVTISTSPEGEDRSDAALSAARAKLAPERRQELAQLNRELTVPESHRDYMARITAAWFK